MKVPRDYGNEPSRQEYVEGIDRILGLVEIQRPIVLVFVHKRVLDNILSYRFGHRSKSVYGFNPAFEELFDTRVFVFPMPGTPCTSAQTSTAMRDLVLAVKQ